MVLAILHKMEFDSQTLEERTKLNKEIDKENYQEETKLINKHNEEKENLKKTQKEYTIYVREKFLLEK